MRRVLAGVEVALVEVGETFPKVGPLTRVTWVHLKVKNYNLNFLDKSYHRRTRVENSEGGFRTFS